MQNISYFYVLKELLRTDLKIFSKIFFNKWIDLFIWILSMIVVFAYVMPAFGLTKDYGIFILASMCSSAGLFQSFNYVAEMVADFQGPRVISYHFSLPVPSWLLFIRLIVYYTIAFSLLGIFILPIGKLFLWHSFSLAQVSYAKYAIMLVLINIFYGSLSLVTTSYVKNLSRIDSVWMRIIYPLWFFGCFQFSWQSLYKVSPVFAQINLLNPLTYMAEGMRATVLGQEGSLNFWLCAAAIVLFSVVFAWHAIVRFKKRLDFV